MINHNFFSKTIYVFFCTFSIISYAGFAPDTLVQMSDGLKPIKEIQLNEKAVCWNIKEGKFEERPVIGTIAYKVADLLRLEVGESIVYVDKAQSFYDPESNSWCASIDLQENQYFLKSDGQSIHIDNVLGISSAAVVYDLVIQEHHNFCVGTTGLVAHNFVIAIPVLAFGFGEVVLATGTLKAITLGAITILTYCTIKKVTGAKEEYESYTPEFIDFNIPEKKYPFGEPEIFGLINFNNPKSNEIKTPDPNGAQAPGIPSEVEGFRPPKNWDGKRLPNPDTGEYGWKDKKGNYWVPTGHKPTAHAGPHWDVQDRNGGHRNVYPGGKER